MGPHFFLEEYWIFFKNGDKKAMQKIIHPHSPQVVSTEYLIGKNSIDLLLDRINTIAPHQIGIIADSVTSSLISIPGATLFEVPLGESAKTLFLAEHLYNQLLAKEFSRGDLLIAVGGGVVCDLAGYIASTFMRGLSLIFVPTTLLAMIDASIGGKNGLNVGKSKNILGTFYPPTAVFIDPIYLETLPPRQIKSGLAEMIKHALIFDRDLFDHLESGLFDWEKLLACNIQIKTTIVAQDPFDHHIRKSLNFGHTFGHALELLGDLFHGEAVALGILAESFLSMEVAGMPESEFSRIFRLLHRLGYLEYELKHSFEEFLFTLSHDKKKKLKIPHSVFLEKIGKVCSFNGEYLAPLTLEMMQRGFDCLKNYTSNPARSAAKL